MIYSKQKVIFIHIPKNAGTTITKALDSAFKIKRKRKRRGPWIHDDKITEQMIDDYFIIAVCRNPWDRAYSTWKYWRRKMKNIKLSFEDFCQADFNTLLPPSQRKHLLQQVELNGQPDFVNPNFWLRFESLQKDYDRVCNHLGLPLTQTISHLNRTSGLHYRAAYTSFTRDLISQRFAQDIEFFNYEF